MIAERLTAQLLAGPPAASPVAVAERLLAVQGQDQRGARLAIRARATGLSAADVDRALTEERSLLITWLNRGTLHLVRSEDYPWLQALTTPPLFKGTARRLAQVGVSLAEARPRRRGDRAVAGRGGPAHPRQLPTASPPPACARGPGPDPHPRRWPPCAGWPCAGRWSGASMRTRWFATGSGSPRQSTATARWPSSPAATSPATAPRTTAISPGGRVCPYATPAPGSARSPRSSSSAPTAWWNSPAGRPPRSCPPPRLHGSFDPVLLGWTSREPLLGADEARIAAGGMFRPFALVRGRAAATWRMPKGEVVLEPFRRLTRADAAALEADAADVVRFLGG